MVTEQREMSLVVPSWLSDREIADLVNLKCADRGIVRPRSVSTRLDLTRYKKEIIIVGDWSPRERKWSREMRIARRMKTLTVTIFAK